MQADVRMPCAAGDILIGKAVLRDGLGNYLTSSHSQDRRMRVSRHKRRSLSSSSATIFTMRQQYSCYFQSNGMNCTTYHCTGIVRIFRKRPQILLKTDTRLQDHGIYAFFMQNCPQNSRKIEAQAEKNSLFFNHQHQADESMKRGI